MLPERLAQIAAEALQSSAPLNPGPATGEPREIAVASASNNSQRRRIVAVIARDDETKTASILLGSSEIEMATDLDLVLSPETSGLPFPLVLQSELYGPVFIEQLRDSLTHIEEELRVAVSSALASDGETLESLKTGTPLAGLQDPRRTFKTQELADLAEIVSECRSWLAGAPGQVTILDPELLLPPPSGSPRSVAEDQYLSLLETLKEVGEGELDFPAELLTLMGMGGFLDEISRWRLDFGLDVARIVGRFRFTQKDGQLDTDELDDVLTGFLRFMAKADTRTIDVYSTRRCWRRSADMIVIEGEHGACRARLKLLEAA